MAQNLQLPPVTAHPKMIRLYEYWRKKAAGPGLLPSRRDIDPTDIPALLDNIWMLDVVGEPRRFRFRLIGDAIHRTYFDFQLGQAPAADAPHPEQPARSASKEKVPVASA